MPKSLASLYGWGALAMLFVLNLVYSARVLRVAGVPMTVFTIIAGTAVLVGAALIAWAPARRDTLREAQWPALAFVALMVWQAVRAIGQQPRLSLPERDAPELGYFTIPAWPSFAPLVDAALAIAAAVVFVAFWRRERLRDLLLGLGVVMVASGAIGQARALLRDKPSTRLDTGLGGAAVLPVVFILVLGITVGLAWVGHRRVASLVVAAVAAVELVLTGSRSGLIMLLVLALLLAARYVLSSRRGGVRRLDGRVVALVAATALVVMGLIVWLVPQLHRVLSLGDQRRETNLETAWALFTHDWTTVLFGRGLGMVWPWYATDVGIVPTLGEPFWGWIRIPGDDGFLLVNPHSVYLGVLVEGGLVGLALLLCLLGYIVHRAWRARGNVLASTMLTAVCVTYIGFFFDYFLLKNFAASWVWWLVLFAGLRLAAADEPAAPAAAPATTEPSTPERIRPRRGSRSGS